MQFFDLVVAQAETDGRRETARENAARLAMSTPKVQSSGMGNFRRTQPLLFDVIFLEEPLFTQGASVITKPADMLDPIASAGVWYWHRNPKGAYIGAYIYLSVS